MEKLQAILLLGPTGSGKTPLGEWIAEHGIGGRRCRHFDFGAELRRVAEMSVAESPLTADEHEAVRDVLARGALLDDNQFPIARKLLGRFVGRCAGGGREWIVLNGLPRHVGQARDVEELVCVGAVIRLRCSDEVAVRRIEVNAGGDRTGREDDRVAAIQERLRRYRQQTEPLVAHYRKAGARIVDVDVSATANADELYRRVTERMA